MKKMARLLMAMLVLVIFAACESLDTNDLINLKRDNPLDKNNNANTQGGIQIKFDSFTVVYDDNDDEIVNKGETVYLFVNLKNSGTKPATSVKASFSSSSNYITALSPTTEVEYGDISAGGNQNYSYGKYGEAPNYYSYSVKLTVSESTPNNTKIPIGINITDGSGHSWTDSIQVTVAAIDASITYNSHSVVYDNNRDDIINKGETVYLFVNLKNEGSSKAKNVKATFSSSNDYISGFAPASKIDYGDISAGNIQNYGLGGYGNTPDYYIYTIKFTVPNTTPNNTKIPINISATDEFGNIWTDSFEVTVEETGANIDYYSHAVVYDNNDNNVINRGETVYLFINLKNDGSSDANKIKAVFSTSSAYVLGFIPTSEVDYGDITSGNQQSYNYGDYGMTPDLNSYTIKFTVSNNTLANTQIPIAIAITDECNNTWNRSFNVTVSP